MAIVYALVARGSTVLVEFNAAHGNAKTIASQILEKILGIGDNHVYTLQDRYIFHVIIRTNGLTVLCMAYHTAGSECSTLSGFCMFKEIYSRLHFMFKFRALITVICSIRCLRNPFVGTIC